MAWLKWSCIAAALLGGAFFGFLFSLDNATRLSLRLLHLQTEPREAYWWLYAAFALGLFTALLLCLSAYLRGRFVERSLRRTLREREEELARLRAGPRPGTEVTTATAPENESHGSTA